MASTSQPPTSWSPMRALAELWCCAGRSGPAGPVANGNRTDPTPLVLAGASAHEEETVPVVTHGGRKSWVAKISEDVQEIQVDETAGIKRRTIVGTVSTVSEAVSSSSVRSRSSTIESPGAANGIPAPASGSDFGLLAPTAPQPAEDASEDGEPMDMCPAVSEVWQDGVSSNSNSARSTRKSIITGVSATVTGLSGAGSPAAPAGGEDFGVASSAAQARSKSVASSGSAVRFAPQLVESCEIEERVEEDVNNNVRRTTRKSTSSSYASLADTLQATSSSSLPVGGDDFGVSAPLLAPDEMNLELQRLTQQIEEMAVREKHNRLTMIKSQMTPELVAGLRRASAGNPVGNMRTVAPEGGQRWTIAGGKSADHTDFSRLQALVAGDYKEASMSQQSMTADAYQIEEQEKMKAAAQMRRRNHTVHHSSAAAAAEWAEVNVVPESQEWGGMGDSSDEEAGDRQERRESQAYKAREARLSVGAGQMQKEVMLADAEVNVASESKEWAGGGESSDEENPAYNLQKGATQAFQAREKRLTVGAEQLQKDVIVPDAEVSVVAANKEWAGEGDVDSSDDDDVHAPDQLQQHAKRLSVARDIRLSMGAEERQKEEQLADAEVNVVAEGREWAGAADSEDEDDSGATQLEQHATSISQAREKRLTVGAEQLQKGLMLGDGEVGVVAESKDWAGAVDSDEEISAPNELLEQQASQAYAAREKRLTIGAEQLEVQKKELNLEDVSVTAEGKEWAGDADSDDNDEDFSPTNGASAAFTERERRLTVGAEQLEKGLRLADGELTVAQEKKEWAGAADSDDEGSSPKLLEQNASQAYSAREKRLSVGVQQLEKGLILADAELNVVAEKKEWAAEEDSDDDAPNLLEQRASRAFEAREQRLTFGAVQMKKELILADGEMDIVAETKEWTADVDSEEDDVPNWQEKRESQVYSAREKRLTISAEQLEKGVGLTDAEVDVVAESKEWAGEAESDDDDGPNHVEQIASQAYNAREKRLTVGTEQLQKDLQFADAEVTVAAETKEWAGEDGSDDDGPNHLGNAATQAYNAREKRLTVGTEQMQKELMLVDAELKITAEKKEWAGEVDSEEDDAPNWQEKRASVSFNQREKRLSVGAGQLQEKRLSVGEEQF